MMKQTKVEPLTIKSHLPVTNADGTLKLRSNRAFACTRCAGKKAKCDGARPTCHRCRFVGEKCFYLPTPRDMLRQNVEMLAEGVEELAAQLRNLRQANGLPSPVTSESGCSFDGSNSSDISDQDEIMPDLAIKEELENITSGFQRTKNMVGSCKRQCISPPPLDDASSLSSCSSPSLALSPSPPPRTPSVATNTCDNSFMPMEEWQCTLTKTGLRISTNIQFVTELQQVINRLSSPYQTVSSQNTPPASPTSPAIQKSNLWREYGNEHIYDFQRALLKAQQEQHDEISNSNFLKSYVLSHQQAIIQHVVRQFFLCQECTHIDSEAFLKIFESNTGISTDEHSALTLSIVSFWAVHTFSYHDFPTDLPTPPKDLAIYLRHYFSTLAIDVLSHHLDNPHPYVLFAMLNILDYFEISGQMEKALAWHGTAIRLATSLDLHCSSSSIWTALVNKDDWYVEMGYPKRIPCHLLNDRDITGLRRRVLSKFYSPNELTQEDLDAFLEELPSEQNIQSLFLQMDVHKIFLPRSEDPNPPKHAIGSLNSVANAATEAVNILLCSQPCQIEVNQWGRVCEALIAVIQRKNFLEDEVIREVSVSFGKCLEVLNERAGDWVREWIEDFNIILN